MTGGAADGVRETFYLDFGQLGGEVAEGAVDEGAGARVEGHAGKTETQRL